MEQEINETFVKYIEHQVKTAEKFGAQKLNATVEMKKVLKFETALSNVWLKLREITFIYKLSADFFTRRY